MRRIFLTSLLCIILTAINASAYDFEVDGIYYNIISNVDLTVEVTNKHKGSFDRNYSYSGSVVVPDMVRYENKNYSVVRIGYSAFGGDYNDSGSDVTEVVLPETIEEIRSCAFCNCRKLLKINMPENLNIIGGYAFYSTQLATLVIPDCCTAIGFSAFEGCGNLRMIVLGKGLKNIGDKAFRSCSKLLEVFFLASKEPVRGYQVFSGNENLRLYVPSRKTYSFGQEMVSFESSSFEYTGLQPRVVWQSNLGKYKVSMPIEHDRLQKDVGTYSSTFTATCTEMNFQFDVPYSYEITKAPLTVSIYDCEKFYGDENPNFQIKSVMGLKNGESLDGISAKCELSTSATKTSNVGKYAITGSFKSENYNAKIKGGILTVDKAPVKVSVIDISRIYGEDNPVFDVAYEGLKNGESAPTLTEKFSLTTKADRKTHVGKYDVKIEGGASNNYEFIERKAGQLVILKRGLKVVADDISRKYGHKNPNFTCHYVNFANGDTEKSFSEMPNLNCDANEESVAGQYPIMPSGGESDDYDFEYENGTLTIDKSLVKFKQVDNYAVFNRCAQSVETVVEQPSDLSGLEIKAYRLADDGSGYYWNISMDNVKNVGKYKFELRIDNQTTFGNSEAYLTITKAEPNLVWNQSLKPLKIGEKVYLDFSCDNIDSRPYFDNYDNKVIDVDADVEMDNQGKTVYKWYIRGKSTGITNISMYYPSSNNYFESETINKIIKVEENSSVTEIDSDGIKVYTDNGTIRIENAEQLSMVRVYNANGLIVYDGQDKIVSGLNKGLYLVKIGSKIVKVVL